MHVGTIIENINNALSDAIGDQIVKGKAAWNTHLRPKSDELYATGQFPEAYLPKVKAVFEEFGLSGWQERKNHGMVVLEIPAQQLRAVIATPEETVQDASPLGLLNAVTELAWPEHAGAPPIWTEDEDGFDLDYYYTKGAEESLGKMLPKDIAGSSFWFDAEDGYIHITRGHLERFWLKGRFEDGDWRSEPVLKPLADVLAKEDAAKVKRDMSTLERLEWVTSVPWKFENGAYTMAEPEYSATGMVRQFFPTISGLVAKVQDIDLAAKQNIQLSPEYVAQWCSGNYAKASPRVKELDTLIAQAKAVHGAPGRK